MKKLFLILLALSFISISVYSQKRNLSGIIITNKSEPVKNMKVSVLYTRITSKTNKKGEFTVKNVLPDDSIILHINKERYAKFLVGENESVKLIVSESMLDVETNTGTHSSSPFLPITDIQENRAVSIVNARMIKRSNALTLIDAIKTFFPFIQIQSGQDGRYTATIRGNKSLNLSNDALVIVDGMETRLNEIESSINIHDIESIEVNKDGLDYGVKGSNGVIIIKTKH